MSTDPRIQEITLTVSQIRTLAGDKHIRITGKQSRFMNKVPTEDLQAIARAVEQLGSDVTVRITRVTNMVMLAWHTNGTTGAVIENGRVIRPN